MFKNLCVRTTAIWIALLAAFSAPRILQAAILPSKGVFQGFYHENIAGVGKFAFFYVAPELKNQFADYEGKFIEVEVLDAFPINAGSAFIKAVGKIKELPQPPVTVEIKTRFPGTGGNKTFDIVYRFKNTGAQPLELNADTVWFSLKRSREVEDPDGVSSSFSGGYTNRQFGFRGDNEQVRNLIYPTHPGNPSYSYRNNVQLLPGESVSFARHSLANEGGKCEVEVSAQFAEGPQKATEVIGWRAINLPLAQGDLARSSSLRIETKVEHNHEWLTVRGRLHNTGEQNRFIFLKHDPESTHPYRRGALRSVDDPPENVFLPALVQLEGKNKLLDTVLDWRNQDGPWIQKQIDKAGVPFQFNIRPADVFSTGEQGRIELWLATDEGLEKFVLATDLQTVGLPNAASWSEPIDGVHGRIRLAKSCFKLDEPIRFFWQAAAIDNNRTRTLWIESDDDVQISIDGKPAKSGSDVMPTGSRQIPFQSDLELKKMKLAPGKHILEVRVTSATGIPDISKRGNVWMLKGTLTAKTEFEVE